jgi:membrane-associated protein
MTDIQLRKYGEAMEFLQFFDLILHFDRYLGAVIAKYGVMVYWVLFAIVFCETGLVVLPFLPGDTLLFIAGAFCASGALNIWILMALLILAAVSGNTVNYWIGSAIGQRVLTSDYKWLDRKALQKAHAFYETHGGKTIILARFIPFARTFAPFVAGMSQMTFAKFQFYNIIGASLWVIVLVAGGYFFSHIPVVRDHLSVIVLIGVALAFLPLAVVGLRKVCRKVFHS